MTFQIIKSFLISNFYSKRPLEKISCFDLKNSFLRVFFSLLILFNIYLTINISIKTKKILEWLFENRIFVSMINYNRRNETKYTVLLRTSPLVSKFLWKPVENLYLSVLKCHIHGCVSAFFGYTEWWRGSSHSRTP